MKFGDLKTGDVMTMVGKKAVVMAIEKDHPRQPGFWLIVWYLLDDKRLTFDCLSPAFQVIPGSTVHSDGLMTWTRVVNELASPQ